MLVMAMGEVGLNVIGLLSGTADYGVEGLSHVDHLSPPPPHPSCAHRYGSYEEKNLLIRENSRLAHPHNVKFGCKQHTDNT